MAERRIFHCSVIFLLLLSFYILFKAFPDENESHSSGIITSALKTDSATVREVTKHEPLWSVLGCWDRHLELYVYTCKRWSRFGKSRISYYSNSTASLNYEYLRLCGDKNPNPGPTSRKAQDKCSLCQRTTHELEADKCSICGLLYHRRCGGNTSNSSLDKRYYMWTFRTCTKPLRNVDHLALDVPFSRTDVFKNSFFVRICHLWNDLPLGIRESNTLSIFRKNLIAFYYDKFNVDFF